MQGDTGVVFSTAYYLSPSEFRSSRYLEYVLQSGLSIGRMQGESVTNPFVPSDAPTPPAIYWTSGHAATATPTPPIP